MTDSFRFYLILGCLVLPQFIHAADSAATPVPPPQAPFVARPRVGTSWDLKIGAAQKPAAPKADGTTAKPAVTTTWVTEAHYIVGSSITAVSVTYGDGTKAEHFIRGTMDYALYQPAKQTAVIGYGEPRFDDPFVTRGYPGASWVSRVNYAGAELVNDVLCYHFHQDGVIPKEGQPPESMRPELDAWIDVATKIPVQFKIDNSVFSLSSPVPADPNVALPPELDALVQRAEKEAKALELMQQINAKAGSQ